MRNLCCRCHVDFTSPTAFDDHLPCGVPVVRTRRRTSLVTMTSAQTGNVDVIRLCEPECRDEFLCDLGLHGHGGGSAFPRSGKTLVYAAGTAYQVTWDRKISSGVPCDLCEPYWRTKPARQARVATAPPSAAQLAARRFFGTRLS